MAKLEWKAPIEAVHGKLYAGFGAAKRKLANHKGEQYNFSVFYGKRTTEPSANELAARAKFKAISALVASRRNNMQKRVQDAAAFEAQTTYKTFTKYLWSVATAEYTAAQTQS